MSEVIDGARLRDWIGREEIATDRLTPTLVERFRATFDMAGSKPRDGDTAPRLIHFCLCQPAEPTNELDEDGHPARGSFLPPVPLPRRMWAGSDIEFSGDLIIGEQVERRSRVADVTIKEGRSGPLCFVTVDHAIVGHEGVVLRERQTIVYRGVADGDAQRKPEAAPRGPVTHALAATPQLLFRYSALTFNTHRIHYDRSYATGTEGYPGLVVHGPLQAALLFQLATRSRAGLPPRRYVFRSTSPLYDHDEIWLNASERAENTLALWTAHPNGPVAMQAEARWG